MVCILLDPLIVMKSGIFQAWGAVSSVRERDPPPPCPLGPLSYQGSLAAGHTYGGTEGT